MSGYIRIIKQVNIMGKLYRVVPGL